MTQTIEPGGPNAPTPDNYIPSKENTKGLSGWCLNFVAKNLPNLLPLLTTDYVNMYEAKRAEGNEN